MDRIFKDVEKTISYWRMVFWKAVRIIGGEMRAISLVLFVSLILACLATIGFATGNITLNFTDQAWEQYFYNIASFCITTLLLSIILLFGLAYIPAKIDAEKSRKLSLKEYDDINLTFRDDPLTDHQLGLLGHASTNFLKLALRVTNDGGIKIRCGLRMMSLKYSGKGFHPPMKWIEDDRPENQKIDSPIEMKLMKWDEGFDPKEGKIEVAPDGGVGNLLFAESNPHNMEFWFWYIDGKSRNHQTLEGRYWAVFQLEGDYETDGMKAALKPIQYEVEFTYQHRRLDPISVNKTPNITPSLATI